MTISEQHMDEAQKIVADFGACSMDKMSPDYIAECKAKYGSCGCEEYVGRLAAALSAAEARGIVKGLLEARELVVKAQAAVPLVSPQSVVDGRLAFLKYQLVGYGESDEWPPAR